VPNQCLRSEITGTKKHQFHLIKNWIMETETDKGETETTTKNPQKSEEIFFKKPNEAHRFVFCSFCGVAQRSDNISRHFEIWHIAGSKNTLKKG